MFGLTPYNRKNNGLTRKDDFFDVRNFFEDFFTESFIPAVFTASHPIKADIRETDKEYIVDAEIPGVKKENIKLDVRDNTLTISVEQNMETKEERDNYLRRERKYGSYSRSFYVENINQGDVSAKYNEGVLTVTLPKQDKEKETSHKIEIK